MLSKNGFFIYRSLNLIDQGTASSTYSNDNAIFKIMFFFQKKLELLDTGGIEPLRTLSCQDLRSGQHWPLGGEK